MLHKDPDCKSRRRAKYAKMLLDRFIAEQPSDTGLGSAFGSTSTVVAAASIAAEQGAYIPNIGDLLRNPGATQPNAAHERLIELASYAVPTPGSVAAVQQCSSSSAPPQHSSPPPMRGGVERFNRGSSSGGGGGGLPRKPRPPSPTAVAALRAQRAAGATLAAAAATTTTTAVTAASSAGDEHSGGGGVLKGSKHRAGAGGGSGAANAGSSSGGGAVKTVGVQIKTPEDMRLESRSRNQPDRRFFARENALRAARPGLPDEDVLSVLVSSALHLNDVEELADPELLRMHQQQQRQQQQRDDADNDATNVRRLGRKRSFTFKENGAETGGADAAASAAAPDSEASTPAVSGHHRGGPAATLLLPQSPRSSAATVQASDRIDPDVQHFFRDTQGVFHRVQRPPQPPPVPPPHLRGAAANANSASTATALMSSASGGLFLDCAPSGGSPAARQQQQREQRLGYGSEDRGASAFASVTALPPDSRLNSPQQLRAPGVVTESHQQGAAPSGLGAQPLAGIEGGESLGATLSGGAAAAIASAQDASSSPLAATFGSTVAAPSSAPQTGLFSALDPAKLATQQSSSSALPPAGVVAAAAVTSSVHHHHHAKACAPPPAPIVDGRVPADECISAIEAVFPDVKLAQVIQQALVCDDKVEDLYFHSVGEQAGEDVPEVRRGTVSMHEAEDLLFAAPEPALDLFLFLGAFDPQAPAQPLALPEGVDGMESWLKLRQRLALLNGRYDGLQRAVASMLLEQRATDAAVEEQAFADYHASLHKKSKRRGGGGGGADDGSAIAGAELSPAAAGDAAAGGDGSGSASAAAAARKAKASNADQQQQQQSEPLPFAVQPGGGGVNCLALQQLVLPMTRLCEFEIIPWCILDIYCSVLYPSIADLGFVSTYSQDPPLIDFEMFSCLLAVHRLVLHRRESQVLAVRRQPVGPAPNTPWIPIVQRRVMRQTVLVAQAHKRGRMMMMGSSSSSSLAGGHSQSMLNVSAGSALLGQSGRSMSVSSALNRSTGGDFNSVAGGGGASSGVTNITSAPSGMLSMMPTSSLHPSQFVYSQAAQQQQQQQQPSDTQSERSVATGANNNNGNNANANNNTRRLARSNSQHSLHSATTSAEGGGHRDLLSLAFDDGDGPDAQQSYAEFGAADDDDENDEAAQRTEQILQQVISMTFSRARPLPDPPHNCVGVAPTWPDDRPRSRFAVWQQRMREVPSRCNVPDSERPLSYRRLPLYDEDDNPVYEGPPQLSDLYCQALASTAPPPFAVRKLDRDTATKVTRYDRVRPRTARQWRERDPTDGRSVVENCGIVPLKPVLGLRSGLYWVAADKEEEHNNGVRSTNNRYAGSAEEEEQLRERARIDAAEARAAAERERAEREQETKRRMERVASGILARKNSAVSAGLVLGASGVFDRPGSRDGGDGGDADGGHGGGGGLSSRRMSPEQEFVVSGTTASLRAQASAAQTQTRRPFCGMTRTHTPCNPPPLVAMPPPPRPLPSTASSSKQQHHQHHHQMADPRDALDRFNQNPQVPVFRGQTPVKPQVQHDIYAAYVREKEQQEQQQQFDANGEPIPQRPGGAAAGFHVAGGGGGSRSRPGSAATATAGRPGSAAVARNIYLKSPSLASRPGSAAAAAAGGVARPASAQSLPYTGFRGDLRPSSASPSASVAEYFKAYRQQPIPVRRQSPPSSQPPSRKVSPGPRIGGGGAAGNAAAMPYSGGDDDQHQQQQHASHDYLQQQHDLHEQELAAAADKVAELRREFPEADIPPLTRDQSGSFHALLREARREAQKRVAEQAAMDRITQQERTQGGGVAAAGGNGAAVVAGGGGGGQPETSEEFHEKVMSWYKRDIAAGKSYMKGSPSRGRRSPLSGNGGMRR